MEDRYLAFGTLKYVFLGVELHYIPSGANCVTRLWAMMRISDVPSAYAKHCDVYIDLLNFLYRANPRTLGDLGLQTAN